MRKLIHTLMFIMVAMFFTCERIAPNMSSNEELTDMQPNFSLSKTSSNTIVFGPKVFARAKSKPITEQISFSAQNQNNDFQLILQNGGADKYTKVTSCFIILNNDTIIYPKDMDKDVDSLEIDISLLGNNIIAVRIAGKPGSYITITIFKIACPCTVTDIDGNVYQTVQIGDQCWMAENLKVTHYRNEDPILNIINNNDWAALNSPAYCAYDNDEEKAEIYGYLYNWYAVDDDRNIAPEGWHVATDEEWETLVNYLGGAEVAGGKLKEAGLLHWNSPNTGATNESGFTAIPAGYRTYNCGYFVEIGLNDLFWSSTNYTENCAWARNVYYNTAQCHRNLLGDQKRGGFSVRCIKD